MIVENGGRLLAGYIDPLDPGAGASMATRRGQNVRGLLMRQPADVASVLLGALRKPSLPSHLYKA